MRIFVITFILILILMNDAFADVIYFKNGGRIEGIIKERQDDRIIIDVGIGTMTVNVEEIDHIEESAPQEIVRLKKKQLSLEIERGEWAPAGGEDIRMLYCAVKDDKTALQEARQKSNRIRKEISEEEKRISELLEKLDKKGQKLKLINAEKDVKRYNEIVAEMNSVNANLNKVSDKVKTLYENEKELNTNLSKLANKYRSSFQLFRDTLIKRRNDVNKDLLTTDEIYFFEEMSKKIEEIEGDFKKDIAEYTPKDGHIIVDTLINGTVHTQLIVDTGASIVLISTDVASRLGIRYEDIATAIEIIMADNRSATAKPIILKSIKVGDAEVKNVQAAILEREEIGGVDGLLGMTFLSNFIIKVDSADNKLILERVL